MKVRLPQGMGGGPSNMQSMLKQAQKMQEEMAEKQAELEAREYETSAGGGVVSVKINGKTVDHDTIRGTTSYIIMLVAIFVVSAICVIAVEGCDIVTGLSSVATCLNNVGPALGELGPTDNFASLSAVTKLILCFDMLAGRLELFPILMLFSPSTWKKFA